MLKRFSNAWIRPLMALGVFAVMPLHAAAHGPTRQKVTEKITINAPPAAVWARIRNFDALKDWHPAVAESPATQGNTPGSVRELNSATSHLRPAVDGLKTEISHFKVSN